jgi:hypothetical protein
MEDILETDAWLVCRTFMLDETQLVLQRETLASGMGILNCVGK